MQMHEIAPSTVWLRFDHGIKMVDILNMKVSKTFAFAYFTVLMIVCCSCSQLAREEKIPVKDTVTSVPADTQSIVKDSIAPNTIYANETDSAITLYNGEVFVKGHISPKSTPRKYTLNVQPSQVITVTVKPTEKNGNVRINQLQLPDKSFDGPFGDSVRYTIKSKGELSIIIGQNMMAGEPWTGSFVLHVKTQ